MVRFLQHPDIEAIAATALRVAAIPLVTGVYSAIPKTPTFPLITVERVGGSPVVREYMDGADVEVAVWATTKSEGHDIAQRARVVLLELEGTAVTSPVAAFVSSVDDAQGLRWHPDQSTGRDRYVFSLTFSAREN